MQRIEIQIQSRGRETRPGSLRRQGRLPGVVYGAGGADLSVAVDLREFERSGLSRSGSHIVRFASDDSSLNGDMAIIREVQVNPLTGRAVHVDFLRIDVNKPVDAFVPLSFVGKAAGVVEGGILQPLRRELEVRALPDRLPDKIEVDVSSLQIGDAIHIADLQLADGVEAADLQENYTLVTVVPPVVEEAAPAAEAAAEGAAAVQPAAGGEAAGEAAGQEK